VPFLCRLSSDWSPAGLRTLPLDLANSSVQIYHPVFSTDNYDSIVALETALQEVFEHQKSQMPQALRARVIQRWQFRGHGEHRENTAVAGCVYTAFLTATHQIHQPAVVSGNTAKRARRD